MNSYCRFCETWFVSGAPCKTEKQRDRCGEYAFIKEAERLNNSVPTQQLTHGEKQ